MKEKKKPSKQVLKTKPVKPKTVKKEKPKVIPSIVKPLIQKQKENPKLEELQKEMDKRITDNDLLMAQMFKAEKRTSRGAMERIRQMINENTVRINTIKKIMDVLKKTG